MKSNITVEGGVSIKLQIGDYENCEVRGIMSGVPADASDAEIAKAKGTLNRILDASTGEVVSFMRDSGLAIEGKIKASDDNAGAAKPKKEKATKAKPAPVDDDDNNDCIACDGTGKSSLGKDCFPCEGTGKKIDTQNEDDDPAAAPTTPTRRNIDAMSRNELNRVAETYEIKIKRGTEDEELRDLICDELGISSDEEETPVEDDGYTEEELRALSMMAVREIAANNNIDTTALGKTQIVKLIIAATKKGESKTKQKAAATKALPVDADDKFYDV